MGWWESDKPLNQNWKEWAIKKYSWEDENIKHEVLDSSSLVKFSELYLLCERTNKYNGVKYRYCLVVLVRRSTNYYGRSCYMTKEMDETMHPYYYNCPKRILKQLSPPRKLRICGDVMRNIKTWREKNMDKFKRS